MDAHRIVATVAATLLAGALASSASAGTPPVAGTISCSVATYVSAHGPDAIFFHPSLFGGTPRVVHLAGGNDESSCDNSGVTGGKAPITEVLFKLSGAMPDATCTQFITMPSFKNARVKLRFRGQNPKALNVITVANAQGDVATTTYDSGSHTLTITTGPLKGRGFAGATATLHLGFDPNTPIDFVEAGCTPDIGVIGLSFGEMNPSTLDVQ
jgi:hypothetical protein